MEHLTYEVWILGYNEDDSVNDYEKLIATFEDSDTAQWFATNYYFGKPNETPKAKVVVEEVVIEEPYGSASCVNVLMETEL